MYVPKQFQISESRALDIASKNEFATLVDINGQPGQASHLPLLLLPADAGKIKFFGHFAKANPQSANVAKAGRVLAIFTGPHGYVSPLWYDKAQANVGTWDYQAVHILGKLQAISNDEALHLMRQFSENYEDQWTLDAMPEKSRRQLLAAIVPFVLQVETITGVSKLSQNRTKTEQAHIAEKLSLNGHLELAALISHNISNSINEPSYLTGELPND